MALIKCSECGRQISAKAVACPGCGAPAHPPSRAEPEAPSAVTTENAETLSTGTAKVLRSNVPWGPFGFLSRHWRGQYSLARSYWLNTFLISLFAPGIGLVLFPIVSDRPARFSSAAALLVTALGYTAWFWAIRGTWISATRHTAAGGKWGGIAKGMIILGLLRLAGQIAKDSSGIGEHFATLLGKQAGPQYHFQVSEDGKSINITGGINDGAADALIEALKLAPGVRTVAFSSGGGWIREGGLVGNVISQKKLATHTDDECSSACTLAFLAGQTRTVGPRARLGFHQVRSVGRSDDDQGFDVGETQSIYERAHLPSDFIAKVTATPPDQLWYPTIPELRAANVITGTSEWDAARAELTRQFQATLASDVKAIRIPPKAFDDLLDCSVREYIHWLNTTECAYLYDKSTKTLETHLAEQGACLDRVGKLAALAEIDLACTKAYIPNNWSIYADIFAKSFAQRADPRRPNSAAAQQVAACAATQYISELNQTPCTPMNLQAKTSDALFATDCVDRRQATLDRRVVAILADCGAVTRSGRRRE